MLDEAVYSLSGGVRLVSPDPTVIAGIEPKQKAYEKYALDEEVVSHLVKTLKDWCDQIGNILNEDSEKTRKDETDVGPRSELDYWRHRSQTFSTIIDQLKVRECKVALGVLREAKHNNPDAHEVLRKWKGLDNAITDAANEAKDNVKYLNTLDKYTQPLYDGTPMTIIDSLPGLLNNIKMMQQIARYYNTQERMTRNPEQLRR